MPEIKPEVAEGESASPKLSMVRIQTVKKGWWVFKHDRCGRCGGPLEQLSGGRCVCTSCHLRYERKAALEEGLVLVSEPFKTGERKVYADESEIIVGIVRCGPCGTILTEEKWCPRCALEYSITGNGNWTAVMPFSKARGVLDMGDYG